MMPNWIRTGLQVFLLLSFIFQMMIALRSRRDFREDVLPPGLMAAGVVLIIVVDIPGSVPAGVQLGLEITCLCLILAALVLQVKKLKNYLKTAWWLDWKREKK